MSESKKKNSSKPVAMYMSVRTSMAKLRVQESKHRSWAHIYRRHVLVIALSTIVCANGAASQPTAHPPEKNERTAQQSTGPNNKDAALEKADVSDVPIARSVVSAPATYLYPAVDEENREKDAVEQGRMIFWTSWIAIVALLALFIAGAQAGMFLFS